MAKKKGVKYWKKKAWEEFSKYIRIRDAIRTTGERESLVCCSCGKIYPAFGVGCAQAGHFIPGRSNSVLFSEEGVHGQCFNCNMRLKGNWAKYYEFMLETYGQETIDRLMHEAKQIKQYKTFELEEIRDLYKQKFKELNNG